MIWNEIKSNKTNIVSDNHLLIMKNKKKKIDLPLEKTEEEEGKWKRNGGGGREREQEGEGQHREGKQALPPAGGGVPSTSTRQGGVRTLPAGEPVQTRGE